MKSLKQIFAIARTEFRFGLRRGGPVVPLVLIGLFLDAAVLLAVTAEMNNFGYNMEMNFYNDPEKLRKIQQAGIRLPTLSDQADQINTAGLFTSWSFYYVLTFILVGSAVAPTIAADRQFGVMEILRGLPISGGHYLAGKILGVLATGISTALFPLLVYFVISMLTIGSIPMVQLSGLLLMDGIPLLSAALSLGVLSGVMFGRRLPAAGFGLFTGILGLAAIVASSKANPYMGGGFLSPAAAYILRTTDTSGMPRPQVSAGEVVIFLVVMLALFVILMVLARMWLKWKDNF